MLSGDANLREKDDKGQGVLSPSRKADRKSEVNAEPTRSPRLVFICPRVPKYGRATVNPYNTHDELPAHVLKKHMPKLWVME